VLNPGKLQTDIMTMNRWLRWLISGLAAGALAATVGACSDSLPTTTLPDLVKLPEKALSKDEQQNEVNAMIERGQSHQADAVKTIEKGK
jgi:hypothetical protein